MTELPVDLVHWLVALAPLVVLLVLLAGRGWDAPQAGPVGMFLAALTAVVVFRAPFDTLVTSVGVGVWDAIFVLLVVWPALLLYRVTDAAGAFDALRKGIERFSRNDLFLVMSFGWVFASFLQGIAGFGVPVAVVAPLLVALGVKPVAAVVIPLVGHAWANTFGTLGVAWLATGQVINLEDATGTAVRAAALLWIPNLLGGFSVAWLFGRWAAVRHAWPLVLVISAIHGGGQLVLVAFNPILATFFATSAALVALYPLSRWSRYAEPATEVDERPAMDDENDRAAEGPATMSFAWSIVPYVALTVSAVGALAVPPIRRALESVELGPTFEATTTGYGVERSAEDAHAPLTPLTHPVAYLLFATLIAWIAYRARGSFGKEQERSGAISIWRSTAGDAVPASIAIVAFLVLAQILDYSGQTEVLARGMSDFIPAPIYAVLANGIGVLGAFMTSSNTSSNVLFSDLQQNVADAGDLPEPAIIAAQNAGGAIGNAVAPASIVLGATTAGAQGEEGAVLRRTLPWTAAAALAIGAATLLMSAG